MKKTLFLIESPFQLLGALEAIHFFNLSNFVFYIRYSLDTVNDTQMDTLLEIFKLKDNVKKLYIRSSDKTVVDYGKIVFYSWYFKSKLSNTDTLFIGNLESGFLKKIYKSFDNNKIIALDDGSKTITLQNEFSKENYYSFFTIYELVPILNQNIYINNFDSIKEKIGVNTNDNSVLFLGSKLNEVGIISEKYYLELLNNISVYFKKKKIIYIPHRGEDKKKVNEISKISNIDIQYLDYPVELYGLYEESIPSVVVSFYSTALYSMKKLYAIEPIAFYFNYSQYKNKIKIDNLYGYYKKYMKIVDLENFKNK